MNFVVIGQIIQLLCFLSLFKRVLIHFLPNLILLLQLYLWLQFAGLDIRGGGQGGPPPQQNTNRYVPPNRRMEGGGMDGGGASFGNYRGKCILLWTLLLQADRWWWWSMDEGGAVGFVLFDFSKAFDVVSHEILIEKLSKIGVHDSLLRWFVSFLSGHEIKVCVGGNASRARDLRSGVPQGSIFGPSFSWFILTAQPQVWHLHIRFSQI